MASRRVEQAGRYLKEGYTPYEIADHMGVTWATVLQYLTILAGEGYVRRSDILYSLSAEKIEAIWKATAPSKRTKQPSRSTVYYRIETGEFADLWKTNGRGVNRHHLDADLQVVKRFGRRSILLSDM